MFVHATSSLPKSRPLGLQSDAKHTTGTILDLNDVLKTRVAVESH